MCPSNPSSLSSAPLSKSNHSLFATHSNHSLFAPRIRNHYHSLPQESVLIFSPACLTQNNVYFIDFFRVTADVYGKKGDSYATSWYLPFISARITMHKDISRMICEKPSIPRIAARGEGGSGFPQLRLRAVVSAGGYALGHARAAASEADGIGNEQAHTQTTGPYGPAGPGARRAPPAARTRIRSGPAAGIDRAEPRLRGDHPVPPAGRAARMDRSPIPPPPPPSQRTPPPPARPPPGAPPAHAARPRARAGSRRTGRSSTGTSRAWTTGTT
jgi:hypothetical protein